MWSNFIYLGDVILHMHFFHSVGIAITGIIEILPSSSFWSSWRHPAAWVPSYINSWRAYSSSKSRWKGSISIPMQTYIIRGVTCDTRNYIRCGVFVWNYVWHGVLVWNYTKLKQQNMINLQFKFTSSIHHELTHNPTTTKFT